MACLGDEAVDAGLDALGNLVGLIEAVRQIVGEHQAIAPDVEQAPVELHALERALAQVDVAAAVAPGHVVIGLVAHAFAQRMLVHRQIVVAHHVQPLDHVLAAVAPRHARRVADAEMHLAAGEMQILGDLAAGLAAADDQHGALRKRIRIAVVRRMDLHDIVRASRSAKRGITGMW